jgi:hypothetical protein
MLAKSESRSSEIVELLNESCAILFGVLVFILASVLVSISWMWE